MAHIDDADATILTLTPAEVDTLRFILGVVMTDDFESTDDRAAYLSLVEKIERRPFHA